MKPDESTRRDIDRLRELTERNYPQSRKEEIRRLQLDSFRWKGERVPLALLCADPQNAIREYPGIEDPRPFFSLKVKNLLNCVSFSSDLLPTASLDYFGDCVLPSMLGCEIRFPERGTAVEDAAYVGPWIIPMLKEAEDIDRLEMPPLTAGYMPAALEAAAFFREHLPQNVNLSTIWKVEPFTLAELLRGSEIYTDLYDEPERVHRLLDFCTELFIRVERALRRVSGHGDQDNISHWGIVSPGIRLNGDTILNLSPPLLREFVLPQWKKLYEAFGGPIYVHYCSTFTSRGEHLFETFRDCPWVLGLSTQVGFEYYEQHYDELFGRFAVESGYTGANTPDLFGVPGAFEDWASRFSGTGRRTGLVLSYTAKSLEQGRGIMDTYNRYLR